MYDKMRSTKVTDVCRPKLKKVVFDNVSPSITNIKEKKLFLCLYIFNIIDMAIELRDWGPFWDNYTVSFNALKQCLTVFRNVTLYVSKWKAILEILKIILKLFAKTFVFVD